MAKTLIGGNGTDGTSLSNGMGSRQICQTNGWRLKFAPGNTTSAGGTDLGSVDVLSSDRGISNQKEKVELRIPAEGLLTPGALASSAVLMASDLKSHGFNTVSPIH
jgi:hypothetical protein